MGNHYQLSFCSVLAAHYLLVSNGPPFSNGTVFRDENARLRKCPAEEQVECHSVSFTQGGIGDAWSPSKIKGARETGNNCRKPEKTKRHALFPLIPTRAFESSVDDSKRNMEEIGDKYERSGKFTERTRLSDMSPQKKLFQGYWRCLGPSKNQRWAAATMLQVLNYPRNWQQLWKAKEIQTFPLPTHSHRGLREFFG